MSSEESVTESRSEPKSSGHRPFMTTHWSVVVAAGRDSSAESREALESLCQTYWYPLYAYVRRKGYQASEAQDLVQEFFAQLLEKDRLKSADQRRGRFRSFLLSSINHFVANQWRSQQAQKRGGGTPILSLDLESGERRYHHEPSHEMTPERIFERRWAMTVLESVLGRLQEHYEEAGKSRQFERLRPHLLGASERIAYAELGEELGMQEGAVKVAVHRMRQRCRQYLRNQICQTVSSPDDVDEELRHLFEVLGAT